MATTNFFRQIASLDIVGNLCFTISKGSENNLVVSVLLQNEGCADKAKNLIPPMVFRGIPQQIDEAFFEDIKAPIEETSDLLDNMGRYLEQVEEARKASAMEKDKMDKDKKAKDDRDKKYREAMAEVDKLDKEGKPRDAWTILSKIDGYPEYADEIGRRRTELRKQFAPDLFEEAVDNVPQTEQQVEEPPQEVSEELEEIDLFGEDEQEDGTEN